MSAIWLCMLLILHLTFTNLPPSAPVQAAPQPRQMWWGMIDPPGSPASRRRRAKTGCR